MIMKNRILLLTSATALSLVFGAGGVYASPAEDPEITASEISGSDQDATPAAAAQPTLDESKIPVPFREQAQAMQSGTATSEAEPTAEPQQQPAADETPATESSPAPLVSEPEPTVPSAGQPSFHERLQQRRLERMKEHALRYEKLRARAAEKGHELPPSPPWETSDAQVSAPATPRMETGDTAAQDDTSSPEEIFQQMREEHMHRREQHMQRRAQRMQRHQETMARWDSYWETLDAMTPEQKEAVQAIFGSSKNRSSHPATCRQMMPKMCRKQHRDYPQFVPRTGSGYPGHGPGPKFDPMGPRGVEPYLYDFGASPWQGPMRHGGMQPWYGNDPRYFQGPSNPAVAFPRP